MQGVETEIKLRASPDVLEALRGNDLLAGEEQTAQLATTYFDTPDGRLHRAGASLRLRRSGRKREQTYKHAADAAQVNRQEWTVPASGDAPDLHAFAPRARAVLGPMLAGEEPVSFASVDVRRRSRMIRFGESRIELAFDSGAIVAGARDEPVSELELELVDGSLADAIKLALALPLGPDLRWSIEAKGARGFLLARGEKARAVRAAEVRLDAAMSLADGFRAVCWNCLSQFLGNYERVIADADNEALHQSRVAIRRLRAALALFADVVGTDTADHFRDAFGEVASAMGEAREMHVLLQELDKAARQDAQHDAQQDGRQDAPGAGLVEEIGRRRNAALAKAGEQLAGEACQRLLFGFAGWLETVEAHAPDGDDAPPETLPAFADRVLTHHRKRARQAGRHLRSLDDHELHRLRIKVKKLRYAVEFFSCLADGDGPRDEAAKYADVLGKLQDKLGALHDIAERKVDSAPFDGYPPDRAARLHAELEQRLDDSPEHREKLVEASARGFARLIERPQWWRSIDQAGHRREGHGNGEELRALQIRLTAMQRRVIAEERKLLVILEGRDAAGKDSTIKHIVEHMSPRDTRVVALGVPTERDRKAWYFQRWISHLPVGGEIVLFNRSWYNRAGVERVMGFCSDAEYEEFMETVPQFEAMLVRAGFTLIKYYLDISKAEQKRRIAEREHDPLKQWKISALDKKAVRNWDKYSEARNEMLARTHSLFAPWVVVKADDKPKARLALIRDLLLRCGLDGDTEAIVPDPETAFLYGDTALERGRLAE